MDNLIQRFLKKIGYQNINAFEGASFKELVNDKENNRIICIILLEKYLSVKDYTSFFDTLSTFTINGGFSTRLKFVYKKEDECIKEFIEEAVATESDL